MLTDDAKTLAGAFWSLGTARKVVITFRMVESKPTERAIAAFNSLIEHGYIEKVDLPGGGCQYQWRMDMREFREFKDNATWSITSEL